MSSERGGDNGRPGTAGSMESSGSTESTSQSSQQRSANSRHIPSPSLSAGSRHVASPSMVPDANALAENAAAHHAAFMEMARRQIPAMHPGLTWPSTADLSLLQHQQEMQKQLLAGSDPTLMASLQDYQRIMELNALHFQHAAAAGIIPPGMMPSPFLNPHLGAMFPQMKYPPESMLHALMAQRSEAQPVTREAERYDSRSTHVERQKDEGKVSSKEKRASQSSTSSTSSASSGRRRTSVDLPPQRKSSSNSIEERERKLIDRERKHRGSVDMTADIGLTSVLDKMVTSRHPASSASSKGIVNLSSPVESRRSMADNVVHMPSKSSSSVSISNSSSSSHHTVDVLRNVSSSGGMHARPSTITSTKANIRTDRPWQHLEAAEALSQASQSYNSEPISVISSAERRLSNSILESSHSVQRGPSMDPATPPPISSSHYSSVQDTHSFIDNSQQISPTLSTSSRAQCSTPVMDTNLTPTTSRYASSSSNSKRSEDKSDNPSPGQKFLPRVEPSPSSRPLTKKERILGLNRSTNSNTPSATKVNTSEPTAVRSPKSNVVKSLSGKPSAGVSSTSGGKPNSSIVPSGGKPSSSPSAGKPSLFSGDKPNGKPNSSSFSGGKPGSSAPSGGKPVGSVSSTGKPSSFSSGKPHSYSGKPYSSSGKPSSYGSKPNSYSSGKPVSRQLYKPRTAWLQAQRLSYKANTSNSASYGLAPKMILPLKRTSKPMRKKYMYPTRMYALRSRDRKEEEEDSFLSDEDKHEDKEESVSKPGAEEAEKKDVPAIGEADSGSHVDAEAAPTLSAPTKQKAPKKKKAPAKKKVTKAVAAAQKGSQETPESNTHSCDKENVSDDLKAPTAATNLKNLNEKPIDSPVIELVTAGTELVNTDTAAIVDLKKKRKHNERAKHSLSSAAKSAITDSDITNKTSAISETVTDKNSKVCSYSGKIQTKDTVEESITVEAEVQKQDHLLDQKLDSQSKNKLDEKADYLSKKSLLWSSQKLVTETSKAEVASNSQNDVSESGHDQEGKDNPDKPAAVTEPPQAESYPTTSAPAAGHTFAVNLSNIFQSLQRKPTRRSSTTSSTDNKIKSTSSVPSNSYSLAVTANEDVFTREKSPMKEAKIVLERLPDRKRDSEATSASVCADVTPTIADHTIASDDEDGELTIDLPEEEDKVTSDKKPVGVEIELKDKAVEVVAGESTEDEDGDACNSYDFLKSMLNDEDDDRDSCDTGSVKGTGDIVGVEDKDGVNAKTGESKLNVGSDPEELPKPEETKATTKRGRGRAPTAKRQAPPKKAAAKTKGRKPAKKSGRNDVDDTKADVSESQQEIVPEVVKEPIPEPQLKKQASTVLPNEEKLQNKKKGRHQKESTPNVSDEREESEERPSSRASDNGISHYKKRHRRSKHEKGFYLEDDDEDRDTQSPMTASITTTGLGPIKIKIRTVDPVNKTAHTMSLGCDRSSVLSDHDDNSRSREDFVKASKSKRGRKKRSKDRSVEKQLKDRASMEKQLEARASVEKQIKDRSPVGKQRPSLEIEEQISVEKHTVSNEQDMPSDKPESHKIERSFQDVLENLNALNQYSSAEASGSNSADENTDPADEKATPVTGQRFDVDSVQDATTLQSQKPDKIEDKIMEETENLLAGLKNNKPPKTAAKGRGRGASKRKAKATARDKLGQKRVCASDTEVPNIPMLDSVTAPPKNKGISDTFVPEASCSPPQLYPEKPPICSPTQDLASAITAVEKLASELAAELDPPTMSPRHKETSSELPPKPEENKVAPLTIKIPTLKLSTRPAAKSPTKAQKLLNHSKSPRSTERDLWASATVDTDTSHNTTNQSENEVQQSSASESETPKRNRLLSFPRRNSTVAETSHDVSTAVPVKQKKGRGSVKAKPKPKSINDSVPKLKPINDSVSSSVSAFNDDPYAFTDEESDPFGPPPSSTTPRSSNKPFFSPKGKSASQKESVSSVVPDKVDSVAPKTAPLLDDYPQDTVKSEEPPVIPLEQTTVPIAEDPMPAIQPVMSSTPVRNSNVAILPPPDVDSMDSCDSFSLPVKKKRGRPRKNPDAPVGPPKKKGRKKAGAFDQQTTALPKLPHVPKAKQKPVDDEPLPPEFKTRMLPSRNAKPPERLAYGDESDVQSEEDEIFPRVVIRGPATVHPAIWRGSIAQQSTSPLPHHAQSPAVPVGHNPNEDEDDGLVEMDDTEWLKRAASIFGGAAPTVGDPGSQTKKSPASAHTPARSTPSRTPARSTPGNSAALPEYDNISLPSPDEDSDDDAVLIRRDTQMCDLQSPEQFAQMKMNHKSSGTIPEHRQDISDGYRSVEYNCSSSRVSNHSPARASYAPTDECANEHNGDDTVSEDYTRMSPSQHSDISSVDQQGDMDDDPMSPQVTYGSESDIEDGEEHSHRDSYSGRQRSRSGYNNNSLDNSPYSQITGSSDHLDRSPSMEPRHIDLRRQSGGSIRYPELPCLEDCCQNGHHQDSLPDLLEQLQQSIELTNGRNESMEDPYYGAEKPRYLFDLATFLSSFKHSEAYKKSLSRGNGDSDIAAQGTDEDSQVPSPDGGFFDQVVYACDTSSMPETTMISMSELLNMPAADNNGDAWNQEQLLQQKAAEKLARRLAKKERKRLKRDAENGVSHKQAVSSRPVPKESSIDNQMDRLLSASTLDASSTETDDLIQFSNLPNGDLSRESKENDKFYHASPHVASESDRIIGMWDILGSPNKLTMPYSGEDPGGGVGSGGVGNHIITASSGNMVTSSGVGNGTHVNSNSSNSWLGTSGGLSDTGCTPGVYTCDCGEVFTDNLMFGQHEAFCTGNKHQYDLALSLSC